MKSICILCPVYREGQAIRGFHERLDRALSPLRDRYVVTIMYALDPSPDETEQVLREISDRDASVELLIMSRRFGHQAALVAGMDQCVADAIVMLDSDGQHPPELIPQMIARWEEGADIVQMLRGESEDVSWLKRVTSRWFYRVLRGIGSINLGSGAADFRLLSAQVLEVMRSELRERNPFVRGLVSWVGFNVDYLPFHPEPRFAGKSHYRASTLANFAIAGICSFSKAPLRACIILGFGVAVISFLVGIAQLLVYFIGDVHVRGWTSIFLALSFLGGVQIFFLGLIGEYVGLIFDEVKARPRYILRSHYQSGKKLPKMNNKTWKKNSKHE